MIIKSHRYNLRKYLRRFDVKNLVIEFKKFSTLRYVISYLNKWLSVIIEPSPFERIVQNCPDFKQIAQKCLLSSYQFYV